MTDSGSNISSIRSHTAMLLPNMTVWEHALQRMPTVMVWSPGLVKRALNASQGQVDVCTLAAATAQREPTVRAGLVWLEARGHIAILEEDGGVVHLAAGSRAASGDLERIRTELNALIEETAAYRAYFIRAASEQLV